MREVDRLIEQYGIERVIEAVTPLLADGRIDNLEHKLAAKLESLTVVLEQLYDPHNGAAAMRSVEAFGLSDVHVVDGETGSFSASAEVTMGSHKWLDLHRHRSAEACADELRRRGFLLLATVPGAELELEDIDVSRPLALWFGNERDGLSEAAVELCDHQVRIDMQGFSQSFNLSVSVALFVHRLAARRRAFLQVPGDLSEERTAFLRARWRAQGIRGLRHILERAHL
jgi:tRNA (guanosine-2'-O-)-methyltransferase